MNVYYDLIKRDFVQIRYRDRGSFRRYNNP